MSHRLSIDRSVPVFGALLWLAACGGGVAQGPGIGAEDGSHEGGADAPSDLACPAAAPAGNTACSHEGVLCEYGASFDEACNQLIACTGGVWVADPGVCPPQDPSCAPSFHPLDAACDNAGAVCIYPQGECLCGTIHGSSAWLCSAPPDSGCPATRPREGSVCDVSLTLDCYYGDSCGELDQPDLQCRDGIWQRDTEVGHGCS